MLLATVIWGSSYLFMKSGLASIQELNLIALRFGIAFAAAGLLFHRRLRRVDRGTLLAGGILGTALFAALYSLPMVYSERRHLRRVFDQFGRHFCTDINDSLAPAFAGQTTKCQYRGRSRRAWTINTST